MTLINVGVIGSCVSRDNFNSRFNAGYNMLFNCKLSLNHISIPSLLSNKIPYNKNKINHKNSWDNDAIINELERKYMKDIYNSSDLDYLILDFWTDVFFGSVITKDGIFTNNKWRVAQTDFFKNLNDKTVITIFNNQEEYLKIWKSSIDHFVSFLREFMPNTKIIINKARAVKKYITKDGEEKKLYTEYNIELANKTWDIMNNYCINTYGFDYIDVWDENYLSHEDHPWGKYIVHYTKDYYEKFLLELTNLILSDTQKRLHTEFRRGKKNKTPNLVDNSNFVEGKRFWSRWNKRYKIKGNVVTIKNTNLEKENYDSLFSNPIRVTKGKTYTLSFKVFINSDTNFDSYRTIMSLRIFHNTRDFMQKDAKWFANLKYDDFFTVDKFDTWLDINFVFTAKFNGILKLGPSIAKNGHVSWKDVCLKEGIKEAQSWSPSYRDYIYQSENKYKTNNQKSIIMRFFYKIRSKKYTLINTWKKLRGN